MADKHIPKWTWAFWRSGDFFCRWNTGMCPGPPKLTFSSSFGTSGWPDHWNEQWLNRSAGPPKVRFQSCRSCCITWLVGVTRVLAPGSDKSNCFSARRCCRSNEHGFDHVWFYWHERFQLFRFSWFAAQVWAGQFQWSRWLSNTSDITQPRSAARQDLNLPPACEAPNLENESEGFGVFLYCGVWSSSNSSPGCHRFP